VGDKIKYITNLISLEIERQDHNLQKKKDINRQTIRKLLND